MIGKKYVNHLKLTLLDIHHIILLPWIISKWGGNIMISEKILLQINEKLKSFHGQFQFLPLKEEDIVFVPNSTKADMNCQIYSAFIAPNNNPYFVNIWVHNSGIILVILTPVSTDPQLIVMPNNQTLCAKPIVL